jgi:DNA-binding response OmpR family regulator
MNISSRKILMAHGDKEEQGKLAIMLARFGHRVSFTDEMTKSEYLIDEYDLIIIDEYLAQGAGFVFLQYLSKTNQAKTIYLSSGGIDERKLFRTSMGIYECLEKPIVPINLAVVVCDFFISSFSNEEKLSPVGA